MVGKFVGRCRGRRPRRPAGGARAAAREMPGIGQASAEGSRPLPTDGVHGCFVGNGLDRSGDVCRCCMVKYCCGVGATIGRPPTYRSNAFSGIVSCKANGRGRAMLAPTRVFRQPENYRVACRDGCLHPPAGRCGHRPLQRLPDDYSFTAAASRASRSLGRVPSITSFSSVCSVAPTPGPAGMPMSIRSAPLTASWRMV